MPVYVLGCEKCNHTVDKVSSIAKRKELEQLDCENCGESKYNIRPSGGSMSYSDGKTNFVLPDGFKSIIKRIKDHNPRNTIDV
ncbi:conserved hypothetical protein [Delftia phage PhiW-14]|uniref:Uncharacterized protein n=1 Tax=Delftia phage PhiW-14 TaxID=665032 RepID=C9DFZ3_BPW14|nr:hypothetical protein DP-phiW-14_gp021 [Delftia phage PhiW-14]ACV50044.1 conserved hypothetical protein [Delftia phage PhiW-14]